MFVPNVGGEVAQWTSPVVTGGLAAWIFYFYRQDRKDAREKMRALLDRYDKHLDDFREIVENNTAAITKLTTLVEQYHSEQVRTKTRNPGNSSL